MNFQLIVFLLTMFSKASAYTLKISSKTGGAFGVGRLRKFGSHTHILTPSRQLAFKIGIFAATSVAGYAYSVGPRSSTSLSAFCEGAATAADKFDGTDMYPPISHYFKGMLKVSDVHSIAYSLYGNPNGKPG